MLRFMVPVLTLLTAAVGVHPSCAGDLKAIYLRREINKQKLTGQVKDTIERSRRLDSRDARFLLENMMREVKDSRDLSESERTPLIQHLQAQLREIGVLHRLPDIAHAIVGSVVAGLKQETQKPKNLAAKLHAELIRERERLRLEFLFGKRSLSAALRAVIGFAASDELPKNATLGELHYWQRPNQPLCGASSWQPPLSQRETHLLKTLNSVLSVNYINEKFKDVLIDLEKRTGLTLIVDDASKRELKLNYDAPITYQADKASVRVIVRKILGVQGLAYIIKDAETQVMTPKRASEHMVLRYYPADHFVPPFEVPNRFRHPDENSVKTTAILKLVQATMEPDHWSPKGPGTITFDLWSESLIIRASAEVHYQLTHPRFFSR